MATHDNAQLLSLSGHRASYPGTFGVIEDGALADVLPADSDPIASIKLLREPRRYLLVIMKSGTIFKNQLSR